jgi:ubiquinone/menaquinone biosynthesis C-methylase UbiE
MSIFDLPRVPEAEVMDDSCEVEAYSSAAAQSFLDTIDDTFVEHALRLVTGKERGRALDIGTGPGQIVLKLAARLKLWKFVGVDRSAKMIAQAHSNLAATAAGRVEFHSADGNHLAFPDASFSLVMCNSVLHHLAQPRNLLREMARVAKPGAAILLRDLRRPGRFAYPFHARWHGRRYTGAMYKLYRDSVHAAYTAPELQALLDSSPLQGARVFVHRATHIGIERPANLKAECQAD